MTSRVLSPRSTEGRWVRLTSGAWILRRGHTLAEVLPHPNPRERVRYRFVIYVGDRRLESGVAKTLAEAKRASASRADDFLRARAHAERH